MAQIVGHLHHQQQVYYSQQELGHHHQHHSHTQSQDIKYTNESSLRITSNESNFNSDKDKDKRSNHNQTLTRTRIKDLSPSSTSSSCPTTTQRQSKSVQPIPKQLIKGVPSSSHKGRTISARTADHNQDGQIEFITTQGCKGSTISRCCDKLEEEQHEKNKGGPEYPGQVSENTCTLCDDSTLTTYSKSSITDNKDDSSHSIESDGFLFKPDVSYLSVPSSSEEGKGGSRSSSSSSSSLSRDVGESSFLKDHSIDPTKNHINPNIPSNTTYHDLTENGSLNHLDGLLNDLPIIGSRLIRSETCGSSEEEDDEDVDSGMYDISPPPTISHDMNEPAHSRSLVHTHHDHEEDQDEEQGELPFTSYTSNEIIRYSRERGFERWVIGQAAQGRREGSSEIREYEGDGEGRMHIPTSMIQETIVSVSTTPEEMDFKAFSPDADEEPAWMNEERLWLHEDEENDSGVDGLSQVGSSIELELNGNGTVEQRDLREKEGLGRRSRSRALVHHHHQVKPTRIKSKSQSRIRHTIPDEHLSLKDQTKQDLDIAHIAVEEIGLDIYRDGMIDILRGLESGRWRSEDIIRVYLAQIEKYNPELNAIIHLPPKESLYAQARQLDKERMEGKLRGVLHGVPVVVKGSIATEESLGMPTSAGSFALLDMPVEKDAFIVARLREAGAIILAKANMSELNDHKSHQAGAGWSAVGGQTINVYAPHASPGTSSSGNGVSIAAGMCPASIGTETDGSITLPCLQSALYGLKPTVGLLSRAGIVPMTEYMDSPGPMAKNVQDLALLLDVMQGEDPNDVRTLGFARPEKGCDATHGGGYYASVQEPSFAGFRIGVPRENWHNIDPWRRPGRDLPSPELSLAFESAISTMSDLGAIIADPADIPCAVDGSLWKCTKACRAVMVAAEFREYLGRYMKNLPGTGGVRSIEELVEFNKQHADVEMPAGHRGQGIIEACLTAPDIHSEAYKKAKAHVIDTAGRRGIDAVLDEYDLDVIFMIREGQYTLANMAGHPIGIVPIGLLSDGTPFGAYFIGRKNGESTLLRIMAAWEAAMGDRPVPAIARRGRGGTEVY